MSSLDIHEKRKLENLFGMSSGYVLFFSDRTFGEFFSENAEVDIHSDKYTSHGTSKAKKLRAFWKIESDHLVGNVLLGLIKYCEDETDLDKKKLVEECKSIANRLLSGVPNLGPLKKIAVHFDASYLAQQIKRMEQSVESDPPLAIGTAKELIETCCKTILADRGRPIPDNPDISKLTKETLKELKLVPEGVSESSRGSDIIKRILSNLGTIGNGLAELRGLYGTGHGRHGNATGLKPRHAKLAVGAAVTLTSFLFDTHKEM